MNRQRIILPCFASILFLCLLVAPPLFAALMNDGSFENAPSAWEEYFASPCNPTGIGDWSGIAGAPANFDGQQTLWVGGRCDSVPPIVRRNGARQTITLQENAALLSFWFNPVKLNPDPQNLDRAIVIINDDEVWSQDINGLTDPTGWNNALIDISPYANQTITLAFEIRQNTDASIANMFIDYVEILHPSVGISQVITPVGENNFDVEITINNNGDTPLNNLTVTNSSFSSCDRNAGNLPDLAPGDSITHACSASSAASDVENTATVQATATEIAYPVAASHTASASDLNLLLTLLVDPGTVSLPEGDAVSFSFMVTNNGNAALTEVQLSSAQATDCNAVLGSLAEGETAVSNCTYTPTQSGQVTFLATAVEPVTNRETFTETAVTIELLPVVPPSIPTFTQYIPLVTNNVIYHSPLGEPNNACDQAFPITTNQTNQFLAEDTNDWYLFTLNAPGDLTVNLTNFVPVAGQMTIWRGACQNLTFLGQNGDFATAKSIHLTNQPAGTYYVWIINDGLLNPNDKYNLFISTP